MIVDLTPEQADVVPSEGEPVRFFNPRTGRAYRLVPEEMYQRIAALRYDDSPWSPGETGALAGEAFGKLDDTDYSEYLREGV